MSLKPPYDPEPITDVELAFPAHALKLMPLMEDIPEDYPDKELWSHFIRDWFGFGLDPENTYVEPKDGVDPATALRHLAAILGSFEPKHEHKEAAGAWLASLWFDGVAWQRRETKPPGKP